MSPDFCTLPLNLCVWLCFSTAVLLSLSGSQYMPVMDSPPWTLYLQLVQLCLWGLSWSSSQPSHVSFCHPFLFSPCSPYVLAIFNRQWDIYLKREIVIHHHPSEPLSHSVLWYTSAHPFHFIFLCFISPRPPSFWHIGSYILYSLVFIFHKTSIPFYIHHSAYMTLNLFYPLTLLGALLCQCALPLRSHTLQTQSPQTKWQALVGTVGHQG